jgi:hypothetical protein
VDLDSHPGKEMEGNTLSCNVMSITEVGDATVTESTAVQVPAATCLEGCDGTMKAVNEESSSRVLMEPDLVTTPQPSEALTSDLNSLPVSYGRFLIVFVGRFADCFSFCPVLKQLVQQPGISLWFFCLRHLIPGGSTDPHRSYLLSSWTADFFSAFIPSKVDCLVQI